MFASVLLACIPVTLFIKTISCSFNTVPVPLIGAVAVVVILVILFIIYKILKKKREHNVDSLENHSKKGNYVRLEEGDHELEPETDGDDTKTSKSNMKQKKRKTKTKGLSDEMEDTENDSDLSKDRSNGVTDGSRETSIARLQISASYVLSSGQLFVCIHQGENLASGGPGFIPCFEVRITLLPSKIQRFKTKPQSSANPIFDEFFTFDEVFPEDVQVGSLRARVYRLHGRKRSLVGEMKTELSADLELEEQNVENKWREITPADQIAVKGFTIQQL